jgi:hypothetical protein
MQWAASFVQEMKNQDTFVAQFLVADSRQCGDREQLAWDLDEV